MLRFLCFCISAALQSKERLCYLNVWIYYCFFFLLQAFLFGLCKSKTSLSFYLFPFEAKWRSIKKKNLSASKSAEMNARSLYFTNILMSQRSVLLYLLSQAP